MATPRNPALALDAETLLAHSAWLAKFARALVANETELDDVLQQTYAQALAQPPQHTGNLRGWLGTIARNVVRSRARSDTARLAREVALPPPQSVETPDQAVERAELRRLVVEAVLALDEPYRSTLILRFFEEQDVATVARLTRSNEDTVRTRLRRGVARVRELLERRVSDDARGAEDGGAAARALLAVRLRDIAAGAGRTAGAGGGGALVGSAARHLAGAGGRTLAASATRRILTAAAVVATVGGAWWWNASRGAPQRVLPDVASRGPAAPDVARPEPPASAPVVAERAPVPVAPPPVAPPVRAAPQATIRGVVTDPDGKPVSGARVWAILSPAHASRFSMPLFAIPAARFAGPEPSAPLPGDWFGTASDPEGRYEFTGLSTLPGWEIGAYEPTVGAMVTDVYDFDRGHLEAVADVKLVRGTVLHGSVRDEDGRPVGAALVFLFTTCDGKTARLSFTTKPSGPDVGRFDMGFRCGDAFEIACATPGFFATKRGKVTIAPKTKETEFRITLKRRPGVLVRGRIVDRTGLPLALEPLLDARFPATTTNSRPLTASVWAIAPGAVRPEPMLAGVKTGDGVIEGKIDFVGNQYEVVVPEGFRGSLELRLSKTLVGSAPLGDPPRAPDLACDVERLPAQAPQTTFTVRYVDAETRSPIDLERAELLTGIGDVRPGAPVVDAVCDPKHGLVRYRGAPGPARLQPLIRGYAQSVFPLDVPAEPAAEPATLELTPANAGVRGVVLHADGRPFAKAPLTLYRITPAGLVDTSGQPTVANGDGEFEIGPVAKGDHVLVVSGQPDEAPSVTRFVAADPYLDVEVRTAAGHATRFRVAAPSARDAAPPSLRIVDRDGVVLEELGERGAPPAGSAGDLSATLRPGRYTLVAACDGCRDAHVEFDVPAPDAIVVVLEPLGPASK